VLVAGAVGPLGIRIEPYGPTARHEARALFGEQIRALRAGGADCVILETFGDLLEIEQAILAARDVDPAMPVVAQMTVGVDLRTPYGATPADVARALDAWGADVIGLNCSVGPQTILEAVEQMAPVTSRKLSAMPNAGMPREVGGRRMYMASAEYFATYARHLVQGGAKVVGGCCGTTPAHVRAMRQALRVELAMGRSEAGTRAGAAGASNGGPVERRSAPGPRPPWSPRRSRRGRGWGQARRGHVRHVGRDRAAARDRHRQARARRRHAAPRRRGRHQRSGRAAGAEPDGGDRHGARHRAAGGDRGRHALRLPRPQPARDAERPARRRGAGPAQPARHHRRPAEDGAVPGRHGGVRRRRDRAHEPRGQPERGLDPGGNSDRRADALRGRRRA
jgi:hypothetical protein